MCNEANMWTQETLYPIYEALNRRVDFAKYGISFTPSSKHAGNVLFNAAILLTDINAVKVMYQCFVKFEPVPRKKVLKSLDVFVESLDTMPKFQLTRNEITRLVASIMNTELDSFTGYVLYHHLLIIGAGQTLVEKLFQLKKLMNPERYKVDFPYHWNVDYEGVKVTGLHLAYAIEQNDADAAELFYRILTKQQVQCNVENALFQEPQETRLTSHIISNLFRLFPYYPDLSFFQSVLADLGDIFLSEMVPLMITVCTRLYYSDELSKDNIYN